MSAWDDPANIELLLDLHEKKYSAAQIARRIPGTTRNAIIGKLHRLGKSVPRPAGSKRIFIPRRNLMSEKVKSPPLVPIKIKPPRPIEVEVPPSGDGVPFMEARNETCRAIVGRS